MGIYRRPTSLAILTIIIVHCARTLYAQQHQPPTEVRFPVQRPAAWHVRLSPQQFTVQRDAKRLIVQIRPDIISTMAFVPNSSLQSVASVGDGASVIVLKPDANVNAVLAEIQSNNGTKNDLWRV